MTISRMPTIWMALAFLRSVKAMKARTSAHQMRTKVEPTPSKSATLKMFGASASVLAVNAAK